MSIYNTYDEEFENPDEGLTYAQKTLKNQKKPSTYAEKTGSKHDLNDPFVNTFKRNTSSLVGMNTDYGKSKYDKSLQWAEDVDQNDIEGSLNEHRAKTQPWGVKAGAGLARATTKALVEVAKLPGVVGGVIAAPFVEDGEGYDMAFNNAWIRSLDNFNKDVNTELLPVYVKKAVSEGNLWDNISSVDFWATDGADGLGYVAAMMAPGAIFQYAGLGSKLVNLGAKGAKYAGMVEKTEAAVNTMKAMGINGKNIDTGLSVMGNTIFEAGAEAKSVGDHLDQKKPEFIKNFVTTKDYQDKVLKKLEDLDKQRRSGLIDLNTYNELSASASNDVIEETFKQQRALAMRNTFVSNVGVLLGPNAIMHKAIWGKAGKTFTKADDKLLPRINKAGQRYGSAFLSEGAWEEGSQTTIENMFTDKALTNKLGKDNDFNIGDFAKEYINTVSSTEGQKAIFLGGAFGGMMMSYQGRKADNQNRKHTNDVLQGIDEQITNFNNIFDNDIYQKNEDGSFKYKEGTTERLLDNSKVVEVAKSLNFTEQQSTLFDLAVQAGNTEVVEKLKQEAIFNLVLPAIHNGEMGIQALEQKLNADSKFQELIEQDKTSDKENNTKSLVTQTLETAKYLQKQNEKFQEFSKDVIDLSNNEATEKQKNDFINKLNSSYLFIKHNLRQNEKNLKKEEQKRDDILEELNINPELSTKEILDNGRLLGEYKSKNPLLANTLDNIHSLNTNIEKSKKDIADIWQGKDLVNKSFSEYLEKRKEEEKIFQKEKEYNDFLEKVNSAMELKDLDGLNSTNPVLKEALDRKRTLLELQEDTRKNEVKDKNSKNTNAKNVKLSDDLDFITDYFEENDSIKLDEENNYFGLSKDKVIGKNFTVSKINKETKNITIKDETGKSTFTISFESLVKNLESNPEDSFSTEGGLDVNNIQKTEKITSTKDVIYDSVDSKVITINPSTGERYPWISEAAEEYERLPQNKEGRPVEFEINNTEDKSNFKEEWNKALEMIEKKDFSNPEFLIKHLPINVIFPNGGIASLETHNDNYQDKFNRTTRNLREAIIMELINGTSIKSITTTIAGQNNGELQVEDTVLENSILDLYEVSGNKEKINSENLYIVDDLGNLLNGKGQKWAANRKLSRGEVYMKIHTANGTPFPLKLNVQRVNNLQAEALYKLYKYRFEDITSNTKATLIKNIPEDIQEIIKSNLSKELELFKANGKTYDDITIKDLIDLLIWDGTRSPKSQVRFYDGKLLVMNKEYTVEEFNDAKEQFVDQLINNKRQHIKFKDKKGGIKSLSIDNPNRLYLDYLLQNNILNTNAKVNQPTFKGNTSIYLTPDQVKVNGKLSEFNKQIKRNEFKSIIGNFENFKKKFSDLFKLRLKLTNDQSNYIDRYNNEYDRVSTLKADKGTAQLNKTESKRNTSKRGNIIDLSFRDFFNDTKYHNLDKFVEMFSKNVNDINETFSEENNIEFGNESIIKLFSIFNSYAQLFKEKKWKVYSQEFTVGGKIGTFGTNDGRYAGTVDMIVENEIGELFLIDLKTSTLDRTKFKYENTKGEAKDDFLYAYKDKIQLNTYAYLMEQTAPNANIQGLYILPIQLSADKESKNSKFTNADNISDFNEDLPLLEVEYEKDSYENVLGIEAKDLVIKKAPRKSSKFDVSKADPKGESFEGVDLDRFELGSFMDTLPVKEKPKEKVEKKSNEPTFNIIKVLSDFDFEDLDFEINRLTHTSNFVELNKEKYYFNANGPREQRYVFAKKTKTGFDFNVDLTLTELETLKDKIAEMSLEPKRIKSILNNIWNSRLNSVSLSKVETKPANPVVKKTPSVAVKKEEMKVNDIDFTKMSVKEAQTAFLKLSRAYNDRFKSTISTLNGELRNTKDVKTSLKKLISFLEENKIEREEIKTKCK